MFQFYPFFFCKCISWLNGNIYLNSKVIQSLGTSHWFCFDCESVCEGVLCGLFCYSDSDSDYDVAWSDDSCMMNQRGFGSGHVLFDIFLAFTWSGLSTPQKSFFKSLCSTVVIIEALFYCSSTLDAWKLTHLWRAWTLTPAPK